MQRRSLWISLIAFFEDVMRKGEFDVGYMDFIKDYSKTMLKIAKSLRSNSSKLDPKFA